MNAGWSRPDPIPHEAIVDLIVNLDPGNPKIPDTWRYLPENRYLTPTEQYLIINATDRAWHEAQTLMAMDAYDQLEHLQRLDFRVEAMLLDEWLDGVDLTTPDPEEEP